MIYLNLFAAFFRIGLFAFGGAYSFLPLLEKEIVQKYQWLTKEEFLDVLGFVQVSPGAISIKYATYTGYKIAGLAGALIANAGNFLAPALFVLFLTLLYMKHKNLNRVKNAFSLIQPVMLAMMFAVAFRMARSGCCVKPVQIVSMAAAFFIFLFTKIHPAFIVLVSGFLGFFIG